MQKMCEKCIHFEACLNKWEKEHFADCFKLGPKRTDEQIRNIWYREEQLKIPWRR